VALEGCWGVDTRILGCFRMVGRQLFLSADTRVILREKERVVSFSNGTG
jgi:hypothetical protein